MKVSKLFHWLYASVMFIPLMIAPIFALSVRSDNNFQPIEVQVETNKIVDFNQTIVDSYTSDKYSIGNNSGAGQLSRIEPQIPHIVLLKFYLNTNTSQFTNPTQLHFGYFNTSYAFRPIQYNLLHNNTNEGFKYARITLGSYEIQDFMYLTLYNQTGSTLSVSYINFYDLTQMFGAGNEPTVTQFIQWYPNDYYKYTLNETQLLKNYSVETYNDTDVGSQLVYTLYKATDKYFNFNQFLGIGNLFDWFQLNVFNGNAPLGLYIFWNLLIYWLLVSIAWLIFDIAMFVPKLAHRWLDKASLE